MAAHILAVTLASKRVAIDHTETYEVAETCEIAEPCVDADSFEDWEPYGAFEVAEGNRRTAADMHT